MPAFTTQIEHYLEQLRRGHGDVAFFGLLETDHSILPELMAAFRAESSIGIRVFLVYVIWEHRQQSVIPFLGEALLDPEPPVWKEALDGLVALASPAALDVLRAARTRRFPRPRDTEGFRRWLEEAIEQAEERLREDEPGDRPGPQITPEDPAG
jgi:hypothetical protein